MRTLFVPFGPTAYRNASRGFKTLLLWRSSVLSSSGGYSFLWNDSFMSPMQVGVLSKNTENRAPTDTDFVLS